MGLVIRFVEDVTDTLTAVAAGQGEIEDRVFKGRFLRESEELGRVRRLLARLRRDLSAHRPVRCGPVRLPNLARVFRNGAVA